MNDQRPTDPTFGAVILAGGRSSRMGTDKASLPYRGVTLLVHMRGIAGALGAWPILVSGGPAGDLKDPNPGAGPVSGLCAVAAFAQSPSRWIVLPIDMPRLEPATLGKLISADAPAAAFRNHPLPLAFSLDDRNRAVLAKARTRMDAGESVAVREVLELMGAAFIPPSDGEQVQLVNANTPTEWEDLIKPKRGEL